MDLLLIFFVSLNLYDQFWKPIVCLGVGTILAITGCGSIWTCAVGTAPSKGMGLPPKCHIFNKNKFL